jgi:hypothetical protein
VFTAGGNQPRLFAAIDALPWTQIAVEHATIDRAHGRIEVRTIRTLPATPAITGLFPHAAQVFLLERYIYDSDGNSLGAVAVLGITNLTTGQADPAGQGDHSYNKIHDLRTAVGIPAPIRIAGRAVAVPGDCLCCASIALEFEDDAAVKRQTGLAQDLLEGGDALPGGHPGAGRLRLLPPSTIRPSTCRASRVWM